MPANLRVLIVDDEPIARRVLRQELVCLSGVEVVGEADTGEFALKQISTLRPDLVFLDIQMPAMGGFEVLNQVKGDRAPSFVMVTAFDQHAIRAYEAGVVDYLLKPVSQARLQQSVERAARLQQSVERAAPLLKSAANPAELAGGFRQQSSADAARGVTYDPQLRKIVGKAGDDYFLLMPEEVLAFQADGDLVWILTGKQRYLATQNLKVLEERLSSGAFRRIHRNALINVNQIRKLSMITSQRWQVTLSNGLEFIVSKRQARHVRDVLNW